MEERLHDYLWFCDGTCFFPEPACFEFAEARRLKGTAVADWETAEGCLKALVDDELSDEVGFLVLDFTPTDSFARVAEALARFPALRALVLDLRKAPNPDGSWASLSALSELELLFYHGPRLRDANALAQIPGLVAVGIAEEVHDDELASIARHPSLLGVNLPATGFSDEGLRALASSTSLQRIEIGFGKGIEAKDLAILVGGGTCRSIIARGRFTDEDMERIAELRPGGTWEELANLGRIREVRMDWRGSSAGGRAPTAQ